MSKIRLWLLIVIIICGLNLFIFLKKKPQVEITSQINAVKNIEPIEEISLKPPQKKDENLLKSSNEIETKKEIILSIGELTKLAQKFEEKGNLEEAIEKYEQIVKIDPKADAVYNNLGNLYYKKNDFSSAVENFGRALKINKKAAYYNNLGNSYYKTGDYSKAILEYEKALKIEPQAAYVYNNLGDAYLKKGSPLIAANHFKKAISLKPDFILPYSNLAQAYIYKGNYEEAEQILQQGVKENRDELPFYLELAKLYEVQRRYEDQLCLLKEYLIFEPDNRFVQIKVENLKKMVYK